MIQARLKIDGKEVIVYRFPPNERNHYYERVTRGPKSDAIVASVAHDAQQQQKEQQ